MKNCKCAGHDKITVEMLKRLGDKGLLILLENNK